MQGLLLIHPCPRFTQPSLESLQWRRFHSFHGQSIPLLNRSKGKFFLRSNLNVLCWSLKPMLYLLPSMARENCFSPLWQPLKYLKTTIMLLLNHVFSKLITPSSLNLSSHNWPSSSLLILVTWLWTLSNFSISFLNVKPRTAHNTLDEA